MLSVSLAVAALCQSCVRDVEFPEVEQSEWTDVPIPPVVSLDASACVSDGHGTLFLGAREAPSLWRSTDRGQTWTEKSLGINPCCTVTALVAKGTGTVFAALSGGGIFISRNRGDSWTQINNHLTDLRVQSLVASADGGIIAGTSGGKIFRSSNDGALWVEVQGDSITSPVLALVADSAGTVYAGCASQGVFFSTDNGQTWTPSSNGLKSVDVRCLAIGSGGYVLAGTSRSRIYRSTGAGEPWVRIEEDPASFEILAIATDRAGSIYASTLGDGVICSRDGGNSWERADVGLQGLEVYSLLCADDVLLAGTQSYGVFRSTDEGRSWNPPRDYRPTDTNRYEYLWSDNSLSVDSIGTYYLLNNESIFRSRDGGSTWIRACNGVRWNLNCLAIHPSSSIFVGSDLGIFVSNDSGDSWSKADTFPERSIIVYALEVTRNGVIFGHTDTGVLRSEDGGTSWESVFTGTTVTSICTGADGCVYLGTIYSGVMGSTDDGDTWRRMTDSLAINSIDADRVGNVFAVNADGILLCSHDRGANWKTVRLEGGYSYGVVAAPGGEVAVVLNRNNGTLYISRDCFSSRTVVPVPFKYVSMFLSPDGYLFLSERFSPGLHRGKHALY